MKSLNIPATCSFAQDLKKQASDVASQTSKKGQKYSDSTQKEALKKLQNSQSYASKQLDALKKEADAQYQNAQVSTVCTDLIEYDQNNLKQIDTVAQKDACLCRILSVYSPVCLHVSGRLPRSLQAAGEALQDERFSKDLAEVVVVASFFNITLQGLRVFNRFSASQACSMRRLIQGQWSKLTSSSKSTSQSQWDKAEALRARINKQLVEAESSLQETYNSATSYLQQTWDSLKAKAEL